MCLVLGGLGLAGLLAACASQPGVGDTPAEFQTASDESPARARARTRLALASGYFENGQHVVALDEQKKAVQTDPTFADAYNLGGLIYMALGDNALAISNWKDKRTPYQRAEERLNKLRQLFFPVVKIQRRVEVTLD